MTQAIQRTLLISRLGHQRSATTAGRRAIANRVSFHSCDQDSLKLTMSQTAPTRESSSATTARRLVIEPASARLPRTGLSTSVDVSNNHHSESIITDNFSDCGEFGHGSENRCDPEKKAAFLAAKAEADGGAGDFSNGGEGDFNSGANDFNNANAGNDEWVNTDTTSGGAASWENNTAAPAATSGW